MRIHEDNNGLAVNAISSLQDGTDVNGNLYQVLAGSKNISIEFQNGPVQENGVNGLTNEALLEIVRHRMEVLDEKFPCNENRLAITNIINALEHLNDRTVDRLKRKVEGTAQA